MPSFVHESLLWTVGLPSLGVAAVPVLIHLINMMRHRRVEWAAMEFLVQSQKKHRAWVLFKQFLLLLLRMAAVSAVVLAVAQPRLRSQWSGLLGGAPAHHIVLLDDSFSMSDRWADTDAFAEAKKVVERIGDDAARQERAQSFSLFRFSRASRTQRGAAADMLKRPVGNDFTDVLKTTLEKIDATETAAGPAPALRAIAKWLGPAENERRIVYLISDFRARQWNEPAEIHEELLRLNEAGTEIHLIRCVDRARPNLAVVSLAPAEGIRAAGVSWSMDVAVHNYGPSPAQNVSVALNEDGHGRPSVTLAEIPPGKTAKERFWVRFPNAGGHTVAARLESDAVAVDNHRYCAVDVPTDVSVLLIDPDARAQNAKYLDIALAPGDPVRTGIRPQIESPRYLGMKPLDHFAVVDLANVDRLDASAVAALEKYVAAGGGAAFFLGDRTDVPFFNESLYRDGHGLFPVPLRREVELAVDRLEPTPDLRVVPHPLFRVFAGKQNSFLQTVTVSRYFAVPASWRPAMDSGVRVALRLRNGAPLAVERGFGRGRVVAFLTGAAPRWNNWAQNPSFVVLAQELQAYLAQRPAESSSRRVGLPLELRLDPVAYQPQIGFVTPKLSASSTSVGAVRGPDGMWTASFFDTDASGFYEARLTRTDGTTETRRYAVNVDPAEGDLATLDGEQLAPRLEGVKYHFEQASAFQSAAGDTAGNHLGDAVLYALIVLLIGEQMLAYSASCHPTRRRPLHPGVAV